MKDNNFKIITEINNKDILLNELNEKVKKFDESEVTNLNNKLTQSVRLINDYKNEFKVKDEQ